MTGARGLRILKLLCDFTVAAYCVGLMGSPVAALAAGKQPKQPAKNVGSHRVVYVTPVFEEGDPDRNVAVEVETYNSAGRASERMTCLTQMTGPSFDAAKISHVGANIEGKKGQVNYSADYRNGVRQNALLFLDKGAKSDTLVTSGARLPDTKHYFPDETYVIGQPTREGAVSSGLYGACVALIAEANMLEANPNANGMSVRQTGPFTTNSYQRPITEQSVTARDVFLRGSSQYGYFLKELGL